MRTWRKMEELVELGLVRHIGTSNMTIPKLRLVLRDARIKPAVNEMELHPHFQQPELFDFVVSNGIVPSATARSVSPNGRSAIAPRDTVARRPGHRPDCRTSGPSRRVLPEVGRAARPDTDSLLHQPAQLLNLKPSQRSPDRRRDASH